MSIGCFSASPYDNRPERKHKTDGLLIWTGFTIYKTENTKRPIDIDWFSIGQTESIKRPIDMDWFSIDQTENTKRPIDMDWFSIDQTESTKGLLTWTGFL